MVPSPHGIGSSTSPIVIDDSDDDSADARLVAQQLQLSSSGSTASLLSPDITPCPTRSRITGMAGPQTADQQLRGSGTDSMVNGTEYLSRLVSQGHSPGIRHVDSKHLWL